MTKDNCEYTQMLEEKIRILEEENSMIPLLREECAKYKKLAMFNSVSGLYSRNFVNAEIKRIRALKAREIREAINAQREYIALIFIDLDGLKRINDSYGHAAGDKALARLGKALLETARKSDIVAHISGDEFVAIMISTNRSECRHFKTRIKEKLKYLEITFNNEPITFSASIGCISKVLCEKLSFEEMERRADLKMYKMKKANKE